MSSESLYLLVCFLVFVYLVYRPIRKVVLDSLNSKIDDIRLRIAELTKLQSDAESLLLDTKEKISQLPNLKDKAVADGKILADKVLESKKHDIVRLLAIQEEQLLNNLDARYTELYTQLRDQIIDDTVTLVVKYLRELDESSLSDLMIARNLRV